MTGVLEFLGAHVLGPVLATIQRILAKPRPELKIHQLTETGGNQDSVDFAAEIQNVGTKSARVSVTARVDDQAVQVDRPIVELLPSGPSQTVRIFVPRPQLGSLVQAFANEATLYGRTLTVAIAEGRHRASAAWNEVAYDPHNNAERYAIQQREWRIGRGEATEADYSADAQSELLRQHRERVERSRPGSDYET